MRAKAVDNAGTAVYNTFVAATAEVHTNYLGTPVLTINNDNHMSLSLSWEQPTMYPENDEIHYSVLEIDDTGEISSTHVNKSSPYTIDSGLVANRQYTYKIEATTTDTGLTVISTAVSSYVPFIPQLTIERRPMQLTLTWTEPAEQPAGSITYSVLRWNASTSSQNVIASSIQQPYVITDIVQNAVYAYKIQLDSTASGIKTESEPVSARVPVVPVPLSCAVVAGKGSATVNWADLRSSVSSDTTLESYTIYYGAANPIGAIDVSGTDVSYTFNSLTNGTIYNFRISTVVSIDGELVESEKSAIMYAMPIDNTIDTAVYTAVAQQFATTASSGTDIEKDIAAKVFTSFADTEGTTILESMISSDINAVYDLLQTASTVAAERVEAILEGLTTQQQYELFAPPPPVDNTTPAITYTEAVVATGIAVPKALALEFGANDINNTVVATTLLDASAITTALEAVITASNISTTATASITNTQKSVIEGAAAAIIEKAIEVQADTTVSEEDKAISQSNSIATILNVANNIDAVKSNIVDVVISKFTGETIPLTPAAATSLINNIPAERINTALVDVTKTTSVVVPNLTNEISLSSTATNLFFAMKLDITYTITKATFTSLTAIYKQRTITVNAQPVVQRYIIIDGTEYIIGSAMTLFGTNYIMAGAANPVLAPVPATPAINYIDAGNAQAIITFISPPVTGTFYNIVASSAGFSDISRNVVVSDMTVNQYIFDSLTNGQAYTFKVRAVAGTNLTNFDIASPFTDNYGPVTPLAPAGPPAIPNISSVVAGNGSVTITFSASPASNTFYSIVATKTSDSSEITRNVLSTGFSSNLYTFRSLTNGQAYTFKARAVAGTNTSNFSNASEFSTVSSSVTPVSPGGGGGGSSGSGSTSLLSPVPVEVNFEVLVDGNSTLNVFGQEFNISPNNIVVAEYALPVTALYDPTNNIGLIELWEPLDNPDTIVVGLANASATQSETGVTMENAWKVSANRFARGLQRILCDNLDCSGAIPFNLAKYKNNGVAIPEYTTPTDFGHLALSTLAHYMFGHVNATAAITNDKAFIKSMLSLGKLTDSVTTVDDAVVNETAVQGAEARNAVYKYRDSIKDRDDIVMSDWTTGTSTDANLARRLVAEIIKKGRDSATGNLVSSNFSDISTATLANVARQIVGQDASRLMNMDGSERTIDKRILVRFYAGDVIYMNIKVIKPSVSVGSGQRGDVSDITLAASYATEQNYTLKITLG